MDLHLTDLDALCLTVRHPLTRSYIDESIKAYRAGSYKASIVSVWVAVTFDIIAKIRELSDQGERPAQEFISTFDKNVRGNNINKLLQIEGDLLNTAEKEFQFVDPISKRHFERLQQDRHLCAHPAFTTDGQLFMPEPELVRLYIVEAIRNLLSQRPVQGRTILQQFDRDFRGVSFPASAEAITRFVESRYLANTRVSVHVSFANVLAKAMLKLAPTGWDTKIGLLPAAIQAVRDRDPSVWSSSIRPMIANLIEIADDDHLPNAFSLLLRFDDLRAALNAHTNARLLALIQNSPLNQADVRFFEAASLPQFSAAVIARLSAAEIAVKGAVLASFPIQPFWASSCDALRGATSFRGAEALFALFIAPFRDTATPEQLVEVLDIVVGNTEIFHANGIPRALADFVRGISDRHSLRFEHLTKFLNQIDDSRWGRHTYAVALEAFETAGVIIPPKADGADE